MKKMSAPLTGPLRAVGYARVSTTLQGTHGASLEAQKQQIADYCRSRGWKVLRVYTDIASGTKNSRPGLDAMETLLRKKRGGPHILVITKLDRLGRTVKGLIEFVEALKSRGVHLVAIGNSIDTSTSEGTFLFHVLAAVAEMERALVSERTKAVQAHLKSQGMSYVGSAPYGYNRVGPRQPLQPVPEHLQRVRDILTWHLRDKWGYRRIARELTKAGIPSPRGKDHWNPEAVTIIVKNREFYAQRGMVLR